MKTYLIPEKEVEHYRKLILGEQLSCVEEMQIRIDMLGYEAVSINKAKVESNIGDCILIEYDGKMLPFQVVHKLHINNKLRCIMQSYYLLEKRAFDQNTNVWRDCELRSYMNGEMRKKFNEETNSLMTPMEIHTDDYATEDTLWIPSHEEIGYSDTSNMFKKNVGAFTYDYYKK